MCKQSAFIAVIIFLFSLFVGVHSIYAQYTTRSSRGNPPVDTTQLCSRNDISAINSFDRKAKSYVKKFGEVMDMIESSGLAEEEPGTRIPREKANTARRIEKNMENVFGFFLSEEYQEMREVYERCGMEIPRAKIEPSFWTPENISEMISE
ncbi:MAG: hypothetical protein ACLFP8_02205 [Alphaproteobacteria bacterium]